MCLLWRIVLRDNLIFLIYLPDKRSTTFEIVLVHIAPHSYLAGLAPIRIMRAQFTEFDEI